MDAKSLLEQLLGSGQEALSRGREMAEDKLGVPETGEKREAMLSGMGKGALAAGALALLLGTGAGRRLTGTAVKLGGLAAVSGLAYKAFQNWRANQDDAPTDVGNSITALPNTSADARSRALLRAMMAAARADGQIDAGERERISAQLQTLDLDADTLSAMGEELDRPADAKAVAKGADSPAAAAEIYLLSLLVIDEVNPEERAYLQTLATELGLSPALVAELEKQTRAAL